MKKNTELRIIELLVASGLSNIEAQNIILQFLTILSDRGVITINHDSIVLKYY